MTFMNILVDQNIPLAREFFSEFGNVSALPGRKMTASDCRDIDILLVRSVTPVNASLLEGSRVKFVGSCTIGVDHLDIQYLENQGITWGNAPGCNANAVVQYVLSVMALLEADWQQKTIGIIGCGNIGGRLHQRLTALGVDCRCYDPFLSNADNPDLTDLATVLQSDIITCHTPLTKTGPHPSYHLLGKAELAQLKEGALLINSGRGAAIDNQALLDELNRRPLKIALDVWENEPDIHPELLQKVNLATPHIAGYSLEGREQGTFMIYRALQHFLTGADSQTRHRLLNSETSPLELLPEDINDEYQFNRLLLACYTIQNDYQDLMDDQRSGGVSLGQHALGKHFDQLRKNYPSRREYSHFILPDWMEQSPLAAWLQILEGKDA